MDVQLQELIDKIKKDGVASADAQAAAICQKAESEASAIKAAAVAEAESIVTKAKEDAARFEKAGIEAVRQAGRNILLAFKDGIGKELDAVISAGTKEAYTADVLKKLIPEAVKAWPTASSDDLSVILSANACGELESAVCSALKAEIAKGLTVTVDGNLDNGFRVGVKNGGAYYDFSADAVAALFASYLNPKIAAVMKDAAGEL